MSAVGGACGSPEPRRTRHDSVCERADRAGTSPVIAPSSDAASSSNWPDVGVDGVKMAAAPLLHDCSLSVRRGAK